MTEETFPLKLEPHLSLGSAFLGAEQVRLLAQWHPLLPGAFPFNGVEGGLHKQTTALGAVLLPFAE